MKLGYRYSVGRILESLSRSDCTYLEGNLYLFNYNDEVLQALQQETGIEFDHKVLTLKEINWKKLQEKWKP